MYHLVVIDPDRRECTKRIYNDLHNALSDLFTGAIGKFVDIGTDITKPERLYTGGTMNNGYDDEFYFAYPNGFRVCIGKLFIEDASVKEE